MKTIVITGTTSSGKSTLLNLLTASWIAPVSVQPNTLSPISVRGEVLSSIHESIQESDLLQGELVSRSTWLTHMKRPWYQVFALSTWIKEYRFRKILEATGLLKVLTMLSHDPSKAPSSIIELPAFEKLQMNQLPRSAEQQSYADSVLKDASCLIFVFNAEETNPKVDEQALSYLKRLKGIRPPLLVLNRIDLYDADINPHASLDRRLGQIQQAWSKVFGASVSCPSITTVSAGFPALLKSAINPRNQLHTNEIKRLKKMVRSSNVLEDASIDPREWQWPQSRSLVQEVCQVSQVDKLFEIITHTMT